MPPNDLEDWDKRIKPCADAAPSILNTKPWLVSRISDECIELRPDWSKHLKHVDPWHRELLISCGAALFNMRMAIRAAGHDAVVWLLPDEEIPGTESCPHCGHRCGVRDLLASIEVVTKRPHPATLTEERLYEAIRGRRTVREPFTRDMWLNVLTELERVARVEKVDARILHPREVKRWLGLTAAAEKELRADPAYQAELAGWTSGAQPGLGIPPGKFGSRPEPPRYLRDANRDPVRDFGLKWRTQAETARFEKHPWLIVLETSSDMPSAWLRIGAGLQRLLLTAEFYGVHASFLTQRLELYDQQNPSAEPYYEPWNPRPRYAQMVIRVGHE
jgi:hypothetical protein